MAKILVIEDDASIRKTVLSVLTKDGHQLLEADNIQTARALFEQESPDVAIVDVGLPDGSGFALAAQWRASSRIGIVMLTGKSDIDDRVLGLSLGADYYLTKPVDSRELLATVQALLSRMSSHKLLASKDFPLNKWFLDSLSWRLTNELGDEVSLTGKEYVLLKTLAEVGEGYVARKALSMVLGGSSDANAEKAMNVLISRLRRKIKAELRQDIPLKTMRGHGYSFPGLQLVAP
jgi:two-component system OmpR family response regulator